MMLSGSSRPRQTRALPEFSISQALSPPPFRAWNVRLGKTYFVFLLLSILRLFS